MDILTSLTSRLTAALFAVEILAFTLLAKKVDDHRTSAFDDDELIAAGDAALGIRRAGLYLGGMVAMAGALSGPSVGLATDLAAVALFAVAAYIALFVARAVCARAILGGVAADAECARGNIAIGIVEFGILAATGILLNGALTGDAGGLLRGLEAFLLSFVIGQVMFVMLALVFQKMTPFDDQAELRRGNRSVGLELAGLFISLAIILRAALVGPSATVASGIVEFVIAAIAGAVLLLVFLWFVRPLFLPRTKVADQIRADNIAAALMLQGLTVAFSVLLATVVV